MIWPKAFIVFSHQNASERSGDSTPETGTFRITPLMVLYVPLLG